MKEGSMSYPVVSAEVNKAWPALPLDTWKDTCATLHMWTQVIGKIRLALSPRINHWWQVALYVSARGLTTSPVPYGSEIFEIEFDFLDHKLDFRKSDGTVKSFELKPMPVAEFYSRTMAMLSSAGIPVKIHTKPQEVPDPIPFEKDFEHASYDPEYANRFWRILVSSGLAFAEFRSRFIGKNSPVHFFWGSFDLAVTRFSGRRAPERQGADPITKEAYSHEVISAGFWPGGGDVAGPAYYCYAAPEPPGFAQAPVRPQVARYDTKLSEFLLMYDDVRATPSPKDTLLEFLQSTYEAGANLGQWDRRALERQG